jgi:thioredoxin-related protein
MRAFLVALTAALVLAVSCSSAGRAALDGAAARQHGLELLVFEHTDCTYCRVFRRDILSRYQSTAAAAEVPIRFIDLEKADTSSLGLNSPIVMLPTAVVMKDGREVDRIAGYWGPENFFRLLAHIVAKAG